MKLKEGICVRTLNGIVQIAEIKDCVMTDTKGYMHYGDFIKASHNIINLIEENDYVNGKKITRIIPPDVLGDEELTDKRIFSGDEEIFEDDIETVLTKEKFENEAYKVV